MDYRDKAGELKAEKGFDGKECRRVDFLGLVLEHLLDGLGRERLGSLEGHAEGSVPLQTRARGECQQLGEVQSAEDR